MNNKLMGYEAAIKRLKELEKVQKLKKRFSKHPHYDSAKKFQSEYVKAKKEINLLLSIIAAEKRARKLFGKLQKHVNKLPCLPDGDRSGYGSND